MKRYAKLFEQLEETTSTNKKIDALANYFLSASDRDKVWTIALLSHRRPRRSVSTALLRTWAAELAELPLWLFEESYHVVGDLAETIALVTGLGTAPKSPTRQNDTNNNKVERTDSTEKSLSWWIESIRDLKDKEEEDKKSFVLNAWKNLAFYERFLFNKLITGGLRAGVSQKVMLRALAKATGKNAESLAHRIAGKWDPSETTFEELILSEDGRDDESRPYPFFLAYALENDLSEMGAVTDWQIERKWDGIRGQIISRGGEIYVWSRGEELISESFPEFLRLQEVLPDGVVIDGEIIVWAGDHPANFNALQKRIGRKKPGKKILTEYPITMIAYDILEWEGRDVRTEPIAKRRKYLAGLISQINSEEWPLRISEVLAFDDWESVREEWLLSREKHCEGFMLKHIDSPYLVGRKKGHWWKWKVEPFTIDAVMLYAQAGHGRRANLFTDYTFALWDGDLLVPVAKAYSGLTDIEFQEITRWVRKNTKERFGPVRSVNPELVFELAFEGIAASSRHKSGVALRFPRMKRWRRDKTAEQANQLADLKALIV